MDALFVRSILVEPEGTPEYELGAAAARTGLPGKANPFKPGSKCAMRWCYGFDTQLRDLRRAARISVA